MAAARLAVLLALALPLAASAADADPLDATIDRYEAIAARGGWRRVPAGASLAPGRSGTWGGLLLADESLIRGLGVLPPGHPLRRAGMLAAVAGG